MKCEKCGHDNSNLSWNPHVISKILALHLEKTGDFYQTLNSSEWALILSSSQLAKSQGLPRITAQRVGCLMRIVYRDSHSLFEIKAEPTYIKSRRYWAVFKD